MTAFYLPKPRSLQHEVYCALLPPAQFKATPYEGNGFTGTAIITPGYTLNPKDHLIMSEPGGNLLSANLISSYRSPLPAQHTRYDLRLISGQTNGSGWEFTLECRGNPLFLQRAFTPGRGIGVYFSEFVDPQTMTAYAPWKPGWRSCTATGQGIISFIKDEGGITSRRGPNGENVLVIKTVTPDYFLQRTVLEKLPYMLYSVVQAERSAWTTRDRTIEALGFEPVGDPDTPFTADPFAGFANYIDIYTDDPVSILAPRPANEFHFLGSGNPYSITTGLSAPKAMYELLAGHVQCNRGSGWRSILYEIDHEIALDQDPENEVVWLDFGPGTVWDAIQEASRHGMWRAYFDSMSKFHFVPDYCTMNINTISPSLVIQDGRSCAGNLEVVPGTYAQRVNRAVVQGQWSTNFGGGTDPMNMHWTSGMGAAVYPHGQREGGPGSNEFQDGYHGIQSERQAKALYGKQSIRTTAQYTGFPHVLHALALYGKVVAIGLRDPMGAWDFKPGSPSPIGIDTAGGLYGGYGKLFSVEGVSIENQDPDAPGGGVFTASLMMNEICSVM